MSVVTTGNREADAPSYDVVYGQYGPEHFQRKYQKVYDGVLSLLEPDDSVLEIGCGVGVLGNQILGAGIKYRGFDFSDVAVKKACDGAFLPFYEADAYDPETYFPRDFDTVVAIEVLEHLDDLRVLKLLPEGVTIIFSVPDFTYNTHVRFFESEFDVRERYAPYLDFAGTHTYDLDGPKIFLGVGVVNG